MGLRLLLRLSVVVVVIIIIIIIIIIETEGKGVPPRVKVSTTKTTSVWFAPVSLPLVSRTSMTSSVLNADSDRCADTQSAPACKIGRRTSAAALTMYTALSTHVAASNSLEFKVKRSIAEVTSQGRRDLRRRKTTLEARRHGNTSDGPT